jgi:hypothetical protein
VEPELWPSSDEKHNGKLIDNTNSLLQISDLNNDSSMASFKPYFRQILQTFKKASKESKKDSENAAKELVSLEKFEKAQQR